MDTLRNKLMQTCNRHFRPAVLELDGERYEILVKTFTRKNLIKILNEIKDPLQQKKIFSGLFLDPVTKEPFLDDAVIDSMKQRDIQALTELFFRVNTGRDIVAKK